MFIINTDSKGVFADALAIRGCNFHIVERINSTSETENYTENETKIIVLKQDDSGNPLEGVKFDVINSTNKELQNRFKAPHNCEQIPAENVAVKLAKKDRILGINKEYELYSNQFIPLIEKTNMLDRIELQALFDKHFSGGAICHLNMDQEIKDANIMAKLIETCANKGVVYFAINYFNAYQLYKIIHNLAILFTQKVRKIYIFVENARI